jgi:hypothetical protein
LEIPSFVSSFADQIIQYMKVTEHNPQLASSGMRNVNTPPTGSSQIQSPVQKKEILDRKDPSAYSKHFQYISTMISLKDPYFKNVIRNELLNDPDISWEAFESLTTASV